MGVRQRFRLIDPGVFLMGSPAEEGGKQDETPQHEVMLTKPFWIAETECTQAFWKAVTGSNPAKFQGENRPVETVSWEDCTLFLTKLNEVVAGLQARLPLEAEWEYACRAGTVGPFAGSGLWQEMAWALENSGGETHNVKQHPPNAWKIYDMHGNVAEWLGDGLRAYAHAKCIDPIGPVPAIKACHRGGSWNWGVHAARSASRNLLHRDVRGPEQGFRIAVSASSNESGWVYYATGEPHLDRLSKPPDHGVFLGDLKPLPVEVPYKSIANDAWGVRSCLIGTRKCVTFVTVHPPGEFVWPIPKGALQFTTVLARIDILQTFHSSWTYQILIDNKVVFSSPPLSERRNGIPVVIDIPSGARRLTVLTDPLGDNQYDHAILAWPYFRLKPVLQQLSYIPDDAIFLGDLKFTKHHFGGLEFRSFKDATPGDALPIAGKPCTTFLDVHAPASITYEIPDEAHRFTAIGSRKDRDFTAHGTWKYEVWIDDIRAFDSVPLHQKPEGIPIDVAIPTGARELTIKVDDFGDNYQDWSILAYPCFHLKESSNAVARRIGLKPGEVAFRTADGGWVSTLGEDLIVVDNPLEPGVRFQWEWLYSVECIFNLRASNGQYVRVQSDGRVRLMGPPDPQKEYHIMIHASDGAYAIRALGPYFTTNDRKISTKRTFTVGPDESFEIIDVNYPSPPRPAKIDRTALTHEAVVYHAKDQLVFNGIDSCLELKLDIPLKGSSLTIAFWIYYEGYERNWNRAFWLSQSADGKETISLYTSWGRLAWRCGGKDIALSRGEFQLRKWHHVAVVVEGMRNILYVDGFPQRNESSRVAPSLSAPLWFGRSASGEPESYCN